MLILGYLGLQVILECFCADWRGWRLFVVVVVFVVVVHEIQRHLGGPVVVHCRGQGLVTEKLGDVLEPAAVLRLLRHVAVDHVGPELVVVVLTGAQPRAHQRPREDVLRQAYAPLGGLLRVWEHQAEDADARVLGVDVLGHEAEGVAHQPGGRAGHVEVAYLAVLFAEQGHSLGAVGRAVPDVVHEHVGEGPGAHAGPLRPADDEPVPHPAGGAEDGLDGVVREVLLPVEAWEVVLGLGVGFRVACGEIPRPVVARGGVDLAGAGDACEDPTAADEGVHELDAELTTGAIAAPPAGGGGGPADLVVVGDALSTGGDGVLDPDIRRQVVVQGAALAAGDGQEHAGDVGDERAHAVDGAVDVLLAGGAYEATLDGLFSAQHQPVPGGGVEGLQAAQEGDGGPPEVLAESVVEGGVYVGREDAQHGPGVGGGGGEARVHPHPLDPQDEVAVHDSVHAEHQAEVEDAAFDRGHVEGANGFGGGHAREVHAAEEVAALAVVARDGRCGCERGQHLIAEERAHQVVGVALPGALPP